MVAVDSLEERVVLEPLWSSLEQFNDPKWCGAEPEGDSIAANHAAAAIELKKLALHGAVLVSTLRKSGE